jgi:hypothetical protein
MKRFLLIVALSASALLTGCIKPLEPKNDIVQVGTNQTLFVVPLNGENQNSQVKFDSAQYERFKKVAVREYKASYYYLQTGRWEHEGEWRRSEKIILVDRAPITVTCAVDNKANAKADNDAIWIESADSVGFSTGFSISALIQEADTATYLYRYSENALEKTIRTEVRARIQQVASSFAARFPLDMLRAKKNEMLKEITDDVIPFFKDRGITISTIGMFGGMTYENPAIQQAIDSVFIAQQDKEKSAAALAAQRDINAKSDSAAQQEKANVITLAKANAEGAKIKAEGEADAIKSVADAAKDAASNPTFLELRKLEIEAARYAKWNGQLPQTVTILGEGEKTSIMLTK